MATQTLVQPADTLLRRVLRANGVFSTVSGVLFIADAGLIATFLGLASATPIVALGVGLLAFAAALFWDAAQRSISQRDARIVIALDVAWVIGSIAVVVLDPFALTTAGKWAIAIVADIVTVFAVVEYVGLRRARRLADSSTR
jgi:hypothetical protein